MRTRSGLAEAELQRHAAAHAVADHVSLVDVQLVHQRGDPGGEVLGVVGGGDRLVGLAEAEMVGSDQPVLVRERRHGGQEGGLGAAEAVEKQDRLALAGLQVGEGALGGLGSLELEPPRLGVPAGGRQQAHAEVHVVADAELALAVRGHPAPDVLCDRAPGGLVGREQGVGTVVRSRARAWPACPRCGRPTPPGRESRAGSSPCRPGRRTPPGRSGRPASSGAQAPSPSASRMLDAGPARHSASCRSPGPGGRASSARARVCPGSCRRRRGGFSSAGSPRNGAAPVGRGRAWSART